MQENRTCHASAVTTAKFKLEIAKKLSIRVQGMSRSGLYGARQRADRRICGLRETLFAEPQIQIVAANAPVRCIRRG